MEITDSLVSVLDWLQVRLVGVGWHVSLATGNVLGCCGGGGWVGSVVGSAVFGRLDVGALSVALLVGLIDE